MGEQMSAGDWIGKGNQDGISFDWETDYRVECVESLHARKSMSLALFGLFQTGNDPV